MTNTPFNKAYFMISCGHGFMGSSTLQQQAIHLVFGTDEGMVREKASGIFAALTEGTNEFSHEILEAACVGVKGSRIHGIVRELRNENIDVINYTSNISLFIQRALSPAKISSIRLNEEEKKAEVFLKPEEVSLAIGKGGLNIKLASMLTEYTIDVFRELDENVADEDIYLDEFRDEIDGWVIDAIKAIGIDTAKAVLNAPREMLIEKTDLEEETVDEVIRILKSEFEEEPAAEMEPETEAEPEAEPTQE